MRSTMIKLLLLSTLIMVLVFPKHGTAVTEEWVARYNHTGNADFAYDLALDVNGNVYVTGYSINGEGCSDYATVKYGADGTELWVARYDGPGTSYPFGCSDQGYALTVDGDGNVYVTGYSSGDSSNEDIATVKYNASGTEQWVARYDGPVAEDYGRAVAVDSNGNVYVTGESDGSGTGLDIATVKYNASGTEQWVARYNGPGNDEDFSRAVAVDSNGNVYVTGYSYDAGSSYVTIKYNANGTEQWVARYDGSSGGAYALALDAGGNVYVTGYSSGAGTGSDYATVKYAPDGTELWAERYNGPADSTDVAHALVIDDNANVFVTGFSLDLGANYDYATVKYDADGTELWTARYDGPINGSDKAYALAVDGSGNAYVTGQSEGTGNDYATVKYDAYGTELWVARYNGAGDDTDNAEAVAVDAGGNVYVTGRSLGSGSNYDYATIKYSQTRKIAVIREKPNGKQRLFVFNPPPGLDTDTGDPIAYDFSFGSSTSNANNIFMAGVDVDGNGISEIAVIRQKPNGKQRLFIFNAPPGPDTDTGDPIAYDFSFGHQFSDAENIAMAGVDVDGNGIDEIAVIREKISLKQRLFIFNAPPGPDTDTGDPIAYDFSFGDHIGNANNIAMVGVDVDGNGIDEIAVIREMPSNGKHRLFIFNAPPGPDTDTGDPIAYDFDFGHRDSNANNIAIAGIRY